MNIGSKHLIAATLLGALSTACGSTDSNGLHEPNPDDPMMPDPNDMAPPVDPSCDPNAEIPCVEGIAEPCEGLESGYDGDEYCRLPPDPELGLQIHVGPDEYDDPEQAAAYLIEPGAETNWAEVTQFPNTTTVYSRGYRSFMRPGSHHFIMFGTSQAREEGPIVNADGTESAVGIEGQFLGGATKSIQNIDTLGEYPEDQGIATEIPANWYVAVNLHFVNTTDHALLQEIWINYIYIAEEEVTQFVKPITWYGGLAMNIPPGTHTVLSNSGVSCAAPADLRIGMMTAHAHASTLRVTTKMNDSTLLFEDYDWAEPTEWRFNRAVTNPAPDASTMRSGAYSGLVEPVAGDRFSWECEVHNQGTTNLTFSNKVYDGEMCNVFGFYITPNRDATPWACAFF